MPFPALESTVSTKSIYSYLTASAQKEISPNMRRTSTLGFARSEEERFNAT